MLLKFKLFLNWFGQLLVGSGENGKLVKVQFARITTDKVLVYSSGEDDSTVYPGLYSYNYS